MDHQLIIKEKDILSKTSNTQLESMRELQNLFKEEIEKMQHRYSQLEGKYE